MERTNCPASSKFHRMIAYLQEVFKAHNISDPLSNSSPTRFSGSESLPSTPSFFAIISLLFASSALRDWLKLIVIGGFFETCRRLATTSYSELLSSFRLEALFDDDDPTYGKFLPSVDDDLAFPATFVDIVSRRPAILKELVQEARKVFIESQDDRLGIYTSDVNNNWRQIGSRPKRSLKSIVLDSGIKELLLEDAKEFLASREWYSERGIPFRRGYLLYGAPGCGKTSLIHSIAGELDLDVYIISLSRSGLDDNSLNELITELPERCVALMEDIDVALTRGLTRDSDDNPDKTGKDGQEPRVGGPPVQAGRYVTDNNPKYELNVAYSSSRVTLSGLLNCLDGIGAAEGRILFATTNKYSSLDPALTRPGRMDLHIEFKLASKHQARELFCHFYKPKVAIQPLPSEKDEHPHAKFSDDMVESLASQFADLIPERQLSMAALQGFLMTYKSRPSLA
ncbi:hypothetical protein GYMLUDRAFT_243643, partial [Collybiopsis luxurians FD-317 M1]